MIHHISGRLVEKYPSHVIIECAGFGYYVSVSLNTFSKLGDNENCKLFTHVNIFQNVRTGETVQQMFGFYSELEREIFRQLITVSGISASKAMMILTAFSPEEVQKAIAYEDVASLKSIKGIGPKQAEKIIVELKDKIGLSDLNLDKIDLKGNSIKQEALSALVALGFDKKKVEGIISKVLKENPDLEVEEVIKLSLKAL